MKPSIHIAASIPLAVAIWFFTKSIYAGFLCFASGVLIDSDHIIEYIIHFGRKDLRFNKIYRACADLLFERIYLVFHSGELAIVFWVATASTQNIYVLAVALGYSLHLILDFIGNPLHPISYFIIKRFSRNFEVNMLLRRNHPRRIKKN